MWNIEWKQTQFYILYSTFNILSPISKPMLPKKNRIKRKDFPSSQRQANRISSPLFSGNIYRCQGNTQVSVVVSKKIAKTAVARNKIRRRFYSAVSPFIKDSRGVFIVLYPKIKTEEVSFSLLKSEIERMFDFAKSDRVVSIKAR